MNRPLIICGVSGGADSMCMLHILLERGERVAAVHLNHGIRGADADSDENFVRDFCEKNDIPFFSKKISVCDEASACGEGIEECGRRLRYEFFDDLAQELDAEYIATAHNADDNSETVLMNLIRGSGISGLKGIPKRRGKIIRPILNMSRDEIECYCAAHSIPFIHDATNYDDKYIRNLLRHNVMPRLKDINPNLNETLARCGRLLSADDKYLCHLAGEFYTSFSNSDGSVPARALSELDFAISSRVLRIMAEEVGLSLTEAQTRAALETAVSKCPSARIDIKNGAVWRIYDKLYLGLPEEPCEIPETPVNLTGTTQIPGTNLTIYCKYVENFVKIHNSLNTFCINPDIIPSGLTVRSRKSGDTIKLRGRPRFKLKKFLCDKRIPAGMRNKIPVLVSSGKVAAVYSIGTDEYFIPSQGKDAYIIRIRGDD